MFTQIIYYISLSGLKNLLSYDFINVVFNYRMKAKISFFFIIICLNSTSLLCGHKYKVLIWIWLHSNAGNIKGLYLFLVFFLLFWVYFDLIGYILSTAVRVKHSQSQLYLLRSHNINV